MLELRGVTKRFGQTFATKNVSFECEKDEFVVVVGPAGAGKSTTLRMIAGILTPNYGEIFFGDRRMNAVPPERRNVSMAFENYVLYSHMTNYDNLAFPLKARKMSGAAIRKEVDAIAKLLRITEELDRKAGELSGGQRQRIALGRCLIRPADVYLLDEPISHLDARLKIEMRAELKTITARREATVVHVTHDYREAMSLADRMIVLDQGRVMQNGHPQDIYHRPENEFVAGFVGDPPMGFIDVQVRTEDGREALGFVGGTESIELPKGFSVNAASGAASLRVGARANAISLASTRGGGHDIPGTIYLVEAQGHRTLVSAKVGQEILRVVVPNGQAWSVGESVWLRLDSNSLHVFADGRAIHHPDQRSALEKVS